jgi:predicted DNA-binding protein
MNKPYSIQLNEKNVEKLDKLLEAIGGNRSAFFNSLMEQILKAMEIGKVADIKNMTLPQALQLLGKLGKQMDK